MVTVHDTELVTETPIAIELAWVGSEKLLHAVGIGSKAEPSAWLQRHGGHYSHAWAGLRCVRLQNPVVPISSEVRQQELVAQ